MKVNIFYSILVTYILFLKYFNKITNDDLYLLYIDSEIKRTLREPKPLDSLGSCPDISCYIVRAILSS